MNTRAAVLYQMEQPAPYATSRPLVVEELNLEGPGPGEVLVEVAAAGLCHSDLSTIDGSRPRVMPMVLGHEAAGIVRELGAGVQDFAVGDHVVLCCTRTPSNWTTLTLPSTRWPRARRCDRSCNCPDWNGNREH